VLPRIKTDFLEILTATAEKRLSDLVVEFDDRTVATVMLVSGGYPGPYNKGQEITGLERVQESLVFHAGTAQKDEKVVTSGGRVIAVSSYGESIQEAIGRCYSNAQKINFNGRYYRSDIGFDLITSVEPEG
jgi:phosphoribosylamine--glycine ligase